MAVITLIIYAVFLLVSFSIHRKLSRPTVMFNLIWTVLIAISMSGILGITIPEGKIYKFFLIGGISFNLMLGLLNFGERQSILRCKSRSHKKIITNKVKSILVLTLNIIMFVYYVYKGARLIDKFGFSAEAYLSVRGNYYSTENFGSSLEYNIVMYLFDPMLYVNSTILAINLFDKKYKTFTLSLMFINLILRMLISGGRMIVFELGVCILLAYLHTHTKRKRIKLSKSQKRKKRMMYGLLAIAIVGATYVTVLRAGQSSLFEGNALVTLLSNFTGSFSYLDILQKYGLYYPKKLFGRATFAGLLDPFIMVGRYLGITRVDITQNALGTILSEFFHIGKLSYNAMPTMYYFFISDYRRFGLIIGPALLAIYTFIADLRKRKNFTYKNFALYILAMLIIVESPMTWLPFKTSFIVANFLTAFLLSSDKINKE